MIKVHNDCKGKSQSFEATLTDTDQDGFALFQETGYGGTQDEAVAELKCLLAEHIAKLQAASFELTEETLRKRLDEIARGCPQAEEPRRFYR